MLPFTMGALRIELVVAAFEEQLLSLVMISELRTPLLHSNDLAYCSRVHRYMVCASNPHSEHAILRRAMSLFRDATGTVPPRYKIVNV